MARPRWLFKQLRERFDLVQATCVLLLQACSRSAQSGCVAAPQLLPPRQLPRETYMELSRKDICKKAKVCARPNVVIACRAGRCLNPPAMNLCMPRCIRSAVPTSPRTSQARSTATCSSAWIYCQHARNRRLLQTACSSSGLWRMSQGPSSWPTFAGLRLVLPMSSASCPG